MGRSHFSSSTVCVLRVTHVIRPDSKCVCWLSHLTVLSVCFGEPDRNSLVMSQDCGDAIEHACGLQRAPVPTISVVCLMMLQIALLT